MKTAILFCCFAIFLISVPTAHGQTVSLADYDRLDSLLLAGDPNAAMAFWSTVCNPATEDTSSSECEARTELLQDLLNFVAMFEEQKPVKTVELISDGRTQSARYNEAYAGSSAAQAFQSFLDAADRDDRLRAIIFLRTARFYKILFVENTLADAHSNYARADMHFNAEEYNSADSALKQIRYEAGNHPVLLAYADTITYLQERIDAMLLDIEKQHLYWERTESVNSRFSLSLSARLINQPGSNSFPLLMKNATSTITVDVNRVPPTFRTGLGLQAWYRLNKKTSIGVGFDAATFSYSSIHTPQLIFFDFDVSYSRAFFGGQYLLRSAVGMRPFLSFGVGVMRYKYNRIECVVLSDLSERETYKVDSDKFRTGEVTVAVGTQFVPKSNSHWAITSEISWYRPFKKHSFLPLPSLSIDIRIEFLM